MLDGETLQEKISYLRVDLTQMYKSGLFESGPDTNVSDSCENEMGSVESRGRHEIRHEIRRVEGKT